MEFSYKGKCYFIENNMKEPEMFFYKRCWFIIKNNPTNLKEYEELIKLSNLWINSEYLGCEYPEDIKNKLLKYL